MKNIIKKFQTIFIPALAALTAYVLIGGTWLLWLCAVFIVLPCLSVKAAEKVQSYWLKFGAVLGRINTALLLAFTFYIVLTPLAFVYRIFNKRAVEHFKKNNRPSFFENVSGVCERGDFEKMW